MVPITRRRRPAFTLLTVMGTILVFAAVPFKYSGNSIALVWMIAAEVLLIAGITQRELVFRRLGLIAGILTGGVVAWGAQSLLTLRMYSDERLTASGVQLLVCAAIFYANALFLRTRWEELFAEVDAALLTIESYLGAAMAFLGVWAIVTGDWTAIGWAALMLIAATGVRRLGDKHLLAQAGLFSVVTVLRLGATNVHLDHLYPHHVTLRIVTMLLGTAAFYATAWLVRGEATLHRALRAFTLLAAGGALAGLAYLEIAPAWVALAWLGLALALCTLGRRLRVADLCLHEHVLVAGIAISLAVVNLQSASALECYLPVLAAAAGFYAISRCSTLKDASYRAAAGWVHTWIATGLLTALAWQRADAPWLAVVWTLFAFALALADRLFTIEELPLHAHVLALLALGRVVTLNLWLESTWHGVSLRLLTLGSIAALFYALTYVIRMREEQRLLGLQHVYSAVGTALVTWLLWKQLAPMAVADGFAIFGFTLFFAGEWLRQKGLRLQGYALFLASFLRIGTYNLEATAGSWHGISTRVLSIVPVVLIELGVWLFLDRQEDASVNRVERRMGAALAWFSAASTAGLLFTELQAIWIVVAWAAMATVLLAAAWLLRKEIFLRQAALMIVATVVQGMQENIFTTHASPASMWHDAFTTLLLACGLLLAGMPVALAVRRRYQEHPLTAQLDVLLHLNRIEQWVFFAPVVLATLGIVMTVSSGTITLAWALEGLAAVLLGLLVAQRSFRITGLLLLLLCVAKIVFRDAWQLSERDRYVTFIALGAALMLVSVLYNKYRESVLKLL
jgi:hypothetical protein